MKETKEKSNRKLKERNFKLNTLLEVSNTINNLDNDLDLFEHFRKVLTEKLSLGKGVLVSKTDVWSIEIRFGELVDFRDRDLIKLCFDYDKITVLNDTYNPILSIFDVLIPIYHNSSPISYLLLGDFCERNPALAYFLFLEVFFFPRSIYAIFCRCFSTCS